MTQDDYKLWTGDDAGAYTESEWARIVSVMAKRLASFLCLERIDTCSGAMDDDMQLLLANFVCAVLRFQGNNADAQVESKSVRNFTINYQSSNIANAFEQVARNYPDLVENLSACGVGFDAERSHDCHCF